MHSMVLSVSMRVCVDERLFFWRNLVLMHVCHHSGQDSDSV